MEMNVASAPRGGRLDEVAARPPAAVRDQMRALLGSRLLVWAVGVTGFAVHGASDSRVPHLGTVADALAAPVSRWHSVHFQVIAAHAYTRDELTAFFPLYPLLAR